MNIRAIGVIHDARRRAIRRSLLMMRMLPCHGKGGETHATHILLLLLSQAGRELVNLGKVPAQALAKHGDAAGAPLLLPGQEGG